jgi:polyglycine hydrolase-like protein
MTGTEGHVTYQIEDIDGKRLGELRLHWDNPFVGSNSYDESVDPAAANASDFNGFSVLHLGGDGNDAQVRFVLLKGFCGAEDDSSWWCASATPLPMVRAESQRYAAIWQQVRGPSWHALHGLTSADYQKAFESFGQQGFRLTHVDGYSIGGEDRYAAIFEHRVGPPLVAHHGLTAADYQKALDQVTAQGYRLAEISGYSVGDGDRFAAIFERQAGPPWVARHGLTAAAYQDAFDELTGQNYRPTHLSGYSVGGEDRYAAIFEKREGPPWTARHGLTKADYQTAFDTAVRDGFRLAQISGYSVGGEERYAAIFEKGGTTPWEARHGMTAAQYQATFDELVKKGGYRLTQVSGYSVG